MALPDWAVITGVIVSGLGSLALALKARPEARKMNAEGAAALTTASSAIVTSVQTELAALRAQVAEVNAWKKTVDRAMRKHRRWDDEVVATVRAAGLVITDPPAIFEDDD